MGDFMAFLKEYGIIGLAIAVIIGGKAGELVKAIVDGLLMPIVGLVRVMEQFGNDKPTVAAPTLRETASPTTSTPVASGIGAPT